MCCSIPAAQPYQEVSIMGKSDFQRLRIIFILDYLRKNSHPQKPVNASELLEMLSHHDIVCDRKTIYADITALQDYGIDIVKVSGRFGGFYITSRNFEPSEMKLLIDAVQSSRFLTERKSRELIEKLCALCNEQDAKLVRRDVFVSGRVKTMNESIYFNVDAIQEAIFQNLQISFRYFDWNIDGTRKYREKSYDASPYGLCQDNENCYLLALSPRHGITSYRVDRMSHITLTKKRRVPCPELTGKALHEYARRRFQMYSGETTDVKIRFHRDLANVVIDRFGQEVMMFPDGDDYFVFTASVAVSPLFLSWIIGFGPKAQILYPQSVIDACQEMCTAVLAQYSSSPKD